MNQIALAWPSVRRRPASFFATFVTVLLGSALVMTFASLLETLLFASVPVDDASEQTLLLIGVVTGGWGLVLVLFAVSSTLTVALRQRDREVSLLKAAGATPAQIRLTVVFEALILTGFAVVVAVPMAWAAGSWFLGQLQANGLVTSAIPHSFGPISIGVATVVAGSGAVGAALVAARRSAKQTTRESIVSASVEAEGMSRFRSLVGRILVASGVVCGILTAVLFRGSGIDAMSTGAQASLLTAIGLALLAPGFVQATARGMSRIGGERRCRLAPGRAQHGSAEPDIIRLDGAGDRPRGRGCG